jgi:large subunit ribosomal protein L22
MTATKTNERPGTRAQVRYVRVSASKAREVLDLIRNQPVSMALEILDFTERDVAIIIRKVLESAVANAEHNDGQVADELAVVSCYADEGPTLKRFRPRARGRASRIRKRTCHITVIVARMDDEMLEHLRQRQEVGGRAGTAAGAAAARRERVARSRQAKADRVAAAETEEAAAETEEDVAEDAPGEDSGDETAGTPGEAVADAVEADTSGTPGDEASSDDSAADDASDEAGEEASGDTGEEPGGDADDKAEDKEEGES